MSTEDRRDEASEEDPRVLLALERERRHLQKAIAVAALIPVVAGLYGVLFGPALTGERLSPSGDSHYRYLAGLHFGVGLLFWSTIPTIEATGPRFRLLTLLVVIGGLARSFGMTMAGVPSLYMLGALVMELVVTPLLCLWQWRVARGYFVRERAPRRTAVASAPADVTPSSRDARPHVMPDDLPEPIPDQAAAETSRPAPETARSST